MNILINHEKSRVWLKVLVTLVLHIAVFMLIFLFPLLLLNVYSNVLMGDTVIATLLAIVVQTIALYLALRILSRWFVREDANSIPEWYATLMGAFFIIGLFIAPSGLSAVQALGSTIAAYWISKMFFKGKFPDSTDEGILKQPEGRTSIPFVGSLKTFFKKPSTEKTAKSHERVDKTNPMVVEREPEVADEKPTSQEPAVSTHSSDPHDPSFWKDSEHPTN